MSIDACDEIERSRAKRLRAATQATHARLDATIMGLEPFADRERYGRFLRMQYLFHRDIDALYGDPALEGLLPDLAGRRRLGAIAADIADLGLGLPGPDGAPAFGEDPDRAAALGWLYVAEGSNLGAAILLKEARALGLSETFGARHLAAAPEGRGLSWRTFVAALDAVELDEAEEARAAAGAEDAFARVLGLVEWSWDLPGADTAGADS